MKKATAKLLFIPALAIALVMTSCTSPGASPGAEGQTMSHLTKVLKAKKIKIAVQTEAKPWSVLQASGHFEGYDIDLANALGESLGAEVDFVSATNESRIPLLQTDKADVVIASFSAANERAHSVDMTIPYAAVGTLVAVPTDSTIKTYADLDGKSVATSRGSTGEAILKAQFPNAKAVPFQSYADSLQALKSNKVDALIEINTNLAVFVAGDSRFKLLDQPALSPALISMGVKQGDQQWLNYLNTFIRNFNASGANEANTQKWLHDDMAAFLK